MNPNYRAITSPALLDGLEAALLALPETHVVCLDYEATGVALKNDTIVGAGISWEEGQAVYMPTFSPQQGDYGFTFGDTTKVMRALKRLRVVCHKALYDTALCYANYGIALPIWDDTYLLARLLSQPLDLKDIMVKLFHVSEEECKDFQTLMTHHFSAQWRSRGYTAADLPLGMGEWDVDRYGCKDADYGRRAYFHLKPLITREKLDSLHKVEINLMPALRKMVFTGVPVDVSTMGQAIEQVRKHYADLEQEIYKLAGRRFSIGSTKELPALLFQEGVPAVDGSGTKVKMPIIIRSQKTGAPSTNAEVLDQLSGMHPIIDAIADFRNTGTLITKYLAKIPDQTKRDPKGRIYCEWNPLGADSGRITSSSNEDGRGLVWGTNLQNVSKKGYSWTDEHGVVQTRSVREAFVAPPGYKWLRMDYKYIEPKVQASLSKDPALLAAYKNGVDPHTATAALAYNKTIEQIIADTLAGGHLRKDGKVINLALSYGMGIDKLARKLHCNKAKAEEIIDTYWSNLPQLRQEIENTRERLRQTGRVKTFFGRTRFINVEFLRGKNKREYDSAMRKAWNTRIQGTAADLLKIGMLRLYAVVAELNAVPIVPGTPNVELILTVHDEVDLIVRDEMVDQVAPIVALRRAFEVPVPDSWAEVVADVGIGTNWDEKSHTPFKAREPEPFTNWKDIIPAQFGHHIEPEFQNAVAA